MTPSPTGSGPQPVFVVSSGRCGSTLLSQILDDHPAVLSLSELFSLVTAHPRFAGKESGAEFWHRLAAPSPAVDAVVRDGIHVPELVYPYGRGRFAAGDAIPGLLHMTLPMLTDDPDRLYDELAAEVPSWPTRAVPEQYGQLFARLAAGRLVVERTGGSLEYVDELVQAFPGARFVYLSRDGADTALSMSTHVLCRLRVLADQALATLGVTHLEDLGPQHLPLLAEAFAPLMPPYRDGRLMDLDIPVTRFGELWSEMTCSGVAVLATLPAHTWTTLRYEHLVHDPERTLTALADFLAIADPPSWIARAVARADTSRVGRAGCLDTAALASLRAACRPGVEADEMAHASADRT